MKLKKKSGLIGAIIALSAASLVSVGFASWVISQGDEKVVAGSIVADTVDNQIHRISALNWYEMPANTAATLADVAEEEQVDAPIVQYGWAHDDANTIIAQPWLTNDTMVEKLHFKLEVTVTNVDATVLVKDVLSVSAITASAGYTTALGHELVGALPTATLVCDEGKTATTQPFTSEGKASYLLDFVWGDHFNGKNPYDYYNATAVTTALADDANASLDQLHTDLADVVYNLTVTAI